MQINVMETRIDKRCIEFVANHIAQYGGIPSVWDTWQAAQKSTVPAVHADNIDYTPAFETELISCRADHVFYAGDGDIKILSQRLNSAIKASQNFA